MPAPPLDYPAWLAQVGTQIAALRVTLSEPPPTGSLLTQGISDNLEAIDCAAVQLEGEISGVVKAIRDLNEDDAADIAAENARPGSLARQLGHVRP